VSLRLRHAAVPILQSALAATIAWIVARHLIGHQRPFFAPIAAVIVIGVGPGRRTRRAIEVWLGVTLGILVADLLVHVIGTGSVQLALVVVLAMGAAVAFGGSPLLVNQAAASAVLITTLQPRGGQRFVDALVGGAIGIAVHAVLLPIDPVATARRALEPLLADLGAVLDDVAVALRTRDPDAVQRALLAGRDVAGLQPGLRDALEVAAETARISPGRRASRAPVERYRETLTWLDAAIRDVRALARAAVRAVELADAVPPEVIDAVDELAAAVRGLGEALRGDDTSVREAALRAAGGATRALEQTANLSVSVIVGQVRSTAVDLLRVLGMSGEDARRRVREAARAR
jgi:uncharacterized membrane protein YgaE (UPF0421/DUF939 family)